MNDLSIFSFYINNSYFSNKSLFYAIILKLRIWFKKKQTILLEWACIAQALISRWLCCPSGSHYFPGWHHHQWLDRFHPKVLENPVKMSYLVPIMYTYTLCTNLNTNGVFVCATDICWSLCNQLIWKKLTKVTNKTGLWNAESYWGNARVEIDRNFGSSVEKYRDRPWEKIL